MPKNHCLLASSAGYGFIAPFEELMVKNRNGKAILKVAEGRTLAAGILIKTGENRSEKKVACLNSDGHLLVFPLSEVVELNKGKGTKLMTVRKEEQLTAVVVLSEKR